MSSATAPPPMNPPVRQRSTRDRPATAPLSEAAVVDAALAILKSDGLEVAGDTDQRFRFAIDVVSDGVLARAPRRY